jgi:endonuclease YncB( thermonuclease family)
MSSPYQLAIKGQLVIVGYEPDGDSVRFIADDPSHYSQLKRNNKIRLSKRDNSVQLRLEGIDAPELHYGNAAQPTGDTARDWLLGKLGFSHVTYKGDSTAVESARPASVAAVIYSAASDVNGRPISYLQIGTAHQPKDGTWTNVTTAVLVRTINAQALRDGVAYTTFYSSTPVSHVSHLRSIASNARADKKGVWDLDRSGLFHLDDQSSIGPDGQLILPKLFRRATDYLKDVAKGFDGNLSDWLKANNSGSRAEDDVVILTGGVEAPLSALLDQRNASVSFTPDLLDIVFVEK